MVHDIMYSTSNVDVYNLGMAIIQKLIWNPLSISERKEYWLIEVSKKVIVACFNFDIPGTTWILS